MQENMKFLDSYMAILTDSAAPVDERCRKARSAVISIIQNIPAEDASQVEGIRDGFGKHIDSLTTILSNPVAPLPVKQAIIDTLSKKIANNSKLITDFGFVLGDTLAREKVATITNAVVNIAAGGEADASNELTSSALVCLAQLAQTDQIEISDDNQENGLCYLDPGKKIALVKDLNNSWCPLTTTKEDPKVILKVGDSSYSCLSGTMVDEAAYSPQIIQNFAANKFDFTNPLDQSMAELNFMIVVYEAFKQGNPATLPSDNLGVASFGASKKLEA